MTPQLLREIGEALAGDRWQSAIARRLAGERDPKSMLRNIQRYDAGKRPVPDWIWPELRAEIDAKIEALRQLRRALKQK